MTKHFWMYVWLKDLATVQHARGVCSIFSDSQAMRDGQGLGTHQEGLRILTKVSLIMYQTSWLVYIHTCVPLRSVCRSNVHAHALVYLQPLICVPAWLFDTVSYRHGCVNVGIRARMRTDICTLLLVLYPASESTSGPYLSSGLHCNGASMTVECLMHAQFCSCFLLAL